MIRGSLRGVKEWTEPQLTNFDSELIYNFAFSRDGRLAMSRGHQVSDVVLINSVK